MRLDGKRALVTGAGRNVGRAIAELFAVEGARVGVVDHEPDRCATAAAELEKHRSGAGLALPCDVTSEAEVRTMVGRAVEQFGGIDVLVNCVAISDRGATVLDLDAERWTAVVSASLTSAFLCIKHAGQQMVRQGIGGAIVNIGSTSAHRGRPNAVAYGAAKAGVANLSLNAARQLGGHGIRVNTVTPNKVGSPVGEEEVNEARESTNLLGRAAQPLDVARAVLFLVSDEAAFITASELLVDGGALYGASG
jgi:NAD(P)-dependent dehydrogenase (short-subunit alcohol dehydrogenase family)